MTKATYTGVNRTGIQSHPIRTRNMLRGMEEFPPTSRGNGAGVGAVRAAYARVAPPTGSMPALADPRASAAMVQFVDKIGARLSFERAGVRLYEAVLSKLDAYGTYDGGPRRDELEQIRADELGHFVLLWETIKELGGDPTAVTPTANLQLVMGRGIVDVIADARTTLVQSLEAILVAELADTESWDTLVKLATDLGRKDLATLFSNALAIEADHIKKVRSWLEAAHR